MNKYPIWWNSTITVFNKHEDKQSNLITWYKTIIPNCFWKYAGDKMTVGDTTLETNSIICRIPKSDKYKEPYVWNDSPSDNFFTLAPGDIIVYGEVTDNINEYQSGMRASDFKAKYKQLQGCMVIERVANNTGVGRGNEHYHVKGI